MSAFKYLLTKTLRMVLGFIGTITVLFILIHNAPGDPAMLMAGEAAPPQYVEMLRERLGLDKPVYEQFIIFWGNVVRGDLGYSFTYQKPVLELFGERLLATFLLMIPSTTFAIIVAVILATVASKRQGSLIDHFITSTTTIVYSIPIFVSSLMLILVFALHLHWLPSHGFGSIGLTGIDYVLDLLRHLFLPCMTLTLNYVCFYMLTARRSLIEVLSQDFIRTARAKGLEEKTVLYRHALRNAILPLVTLIGMNFGVSIGGAILTETIFAWPGVGSLVYGAVRGRDYPVLLGSFVIIGFVVMIVNLVTDIAYIYFDPRIRHREVRG